MKKFGLYGGLFLLMVIWGFNVIAIKLLVTEFTPIMIQSVRILSASLVVFAVLITAKDLRKLTRNEVKYTIFGAATGVVGHHSLLAVGLTDTSASNAGLFLGLVPLMTALFAVLFLKDRMTLLKATGILLALIGVAFVVLSGGEGLGSASLGDLYVFISVTAQAVSFIFIKKGTETMSSRLMTGWMLLVGSSTLFIIGLIVEPQGSGALQEGTLTIWLIFAVSAVFATGLGHMFYNKAIYHIGPGEAAVFNNLTPFFALIGAAIFLSEPIGWEQIIGFVLIVAGVMLGTGTVDYIMKRRERHYASLQSHSQLKG